MDEDTFANKCCRAYVMSFCKTAGALSAIVIVAALLPNKNDTTVPTPTS